MNKFVETFKKTKFEMLKDLHKNLKHHVISHHCEAITQHEYIYTGGINPEEKIDESSFIHI